MIYKPSTLAEAIALLDDGIHGSDIILSTPMIRDIHARLSAVEALAARLAELAGGANR